MPILRRRLALRIARGLTGFVNLEAGLTRGVAPNEPLEAQVQELAQARERLKEQDQRLSTLNQELGQSKNKSTEKDRQLATLKNQLAQRDRRLEEFKRRADRSAKLRKEKQLIEQSRAKIADIKDKLYAHGFVNQALEDLRGLAEDNSQSGLKKLAAWELILWHAHQYSEADARRCLELLPTALEDESGPHLRRAAIIEAECRRILGDIDGARSVISQALERESQADLFFASANLEDSVPDRMKWINKALQLYGTSEISCEVSKDCSLYDSLEPGQDQVEASSNVKVSVIVPIYNAEDVIQTALSSVLSQTWTNLEVLVVDDCSTDATVPLVEDYVKRDSRVHLIRSETNGGTYVARNLGLQKSAGEFVTCHDADDWSHPEKIERQAYHLLGSPLVVGNTSQQAGITEDLRFYRQAYSGFWTLANASSFMFRRETVMEAAGYWNCVRFGADNEFINRIKKIFGSDGVVDLPTGPLSFVRQSSSSLSGSEAFGIRAGFGGVRKEYREAYTHFHNTAENLRYEFPQQERPFPVPEPMWPRREVENGGRRHFDVVLVSDFRLPGGITSSNVEEIKAQKRLGLRTGLVHLQPYESRPFVETNQKIRNLLDGDLTQMLVYGEKVSCDLLVLRHPPILEDRQRFIPDVEASSIRVVVDQTPTKDNDEGKPTYDIGRCEEHLREYFGKAGVWHPKGPSVRKALHEHHAEDLTKITLASEDWSNAMDVNEWWRESQPNARVSGN